MTKTESPLAPICFVFQVSVINALASEFMVSNLAITTSLIITRKNILSDGLSADMLI